MKASRAVGVTFLGGLWLCTAVVAGAAGVEVYLQARARWGPFGSANDRTPVIHTLERLYAPFGVLHLHPQYFFFFPRDPRARVALSNGTCSLDADGFRGGGPSAAGTRQLAFLLGGSAAFGYMASSDEATITGYLNRAQDRYFFVNAGVPSWNSTQEMFRVAVQLLDFHPALVVTYDGANDAQLIDYFGRDAAGYDAGLPEEFNDMAAYFDDRGAMRPQRAAATLAGDLFPELAQRYDDRFGSMARKDQQRSQPLPDTVMQQGAARYIANQVRMRDLVVAQGGRFVATFQPVAQLHRHLAANTIEPFDVIDRFHRAVTSRLPRDLDFHDLGDAFDRDYAVIPVVQPDITKSTVFIDQVHLYDPGNESIARHLADIIR
jgi:hypothetical protein